MRVLHAFKVYKPQRGGIVSVIDQLCHIQGVDARILACEWAPGFAKRRVDDGVAVRQLASLGNFMAMPLAPGYPLALWHEAKSADVVDYHFPFPIVDLSAALYLPKHAALVVHWHSNIVAQKRTGRLLSPMIKRCLDKAEKIIVSTPHHVEHSPLLAPFSAKCEVIPFGINVASWAETDPAFARELAALRSNHPRMILTVGRLVSYKGFDVLIQAIRELDVSLFIVGDGPLRDHLHQLASAVGVSEKVTFEENVSAHRLKTLFHACRAFVLPSVAQNEAFGLVQLEAMACSRPVINTNVHRGVAWVARDGQEAVTVPPRDEMRLQEAIQYLFDHPDEARELGANGYQRVMREFRLEQFKQRSLAAYQEVLQR